MRFSVSVGVGPFRVSSGGRRRPHDYRPPGVRVLAAAISVAVWFVRFIWWVAKEAQK
jgi:hypothetical protein